MWKLLLDYISALLQLVCVWEWMSEMCLLLSARTSDKVESSQHEWRKHENKCFTQKLTVIYMINFRNLFEFVDIQATRNTDGLFFFWENVEWRKYCVILSWKLFGIYCRLEILAKPRVSIVGKVGNWWDRLASKRTDGRICVWGVKV